MHSMSHSLLHRAEGSTLVEYAVVLPILLLLMMGVVEYNTIMYAMAVLDGSIATAAREGSTGYVASGQTRQQFIYGLLQSRAQGLMQAANLSIASKSYADFASIGKPEPCITPSLAPCPGTPGVNFVDVNGNGIWDQDQGAAGLGGAGDIVVYTASYPWPVYTPILRPFLGSNGTFTLSASAVVKNEPYSVAR